MEWSNEMVHSWIQEEMEREITKKLNEINDLTILTLYHDAIERSVRLFVQRKIKEILNDSTRLAETIQAVDEEKLRLLHEEQEIKEFIQRLEEALAKLQVENEQNTLEIVLEEVPFVVLEEIDEEEQALQQELKVMEEEMEWEEEMERAMEELEEEMATQPINVAPSFEPNITPMGVNSSFVPMSMNEDSKQIKQDFIREMQQVEDNWVSPQTVKKEFLVNIEKMGNFTPNTRNQNVILDFPTSKQMNFSDIEDDDI